MKMRAGAGLGFGAQVDMKPDVHFAVGVKHSYFVECVRNGKVVWAEKFDNLIVLAGRNKYLDATLKTGLTSPAWFVGLVTGPGSGNTYAAADTMASHAGWNEFTNYSQGTRQAFTPGTIANGAVDNAAARASFTITMNGTVAGAFMVDNNTKGGSTGTLLGVGNFSQGDRSVLVNDTVNVLVAASIVAL